MNLELYVITDEVIAGGRSHVEIARRAIAGGADAIQLRDKECGSRDLCKAGKAIREITRQAGKLFIVNDRFDVALACGADGIHLGQGDLRADVARQLAPPGFLIGVSVGSAEEALRAEEYGADYVAVSPVFSTRSKGDAGPERGCNVLRDIASRVSVPVVAIGGITPDNIGDVIAAGADGVAVISAVAGRPDIIAAARELKDLITRYKQKRCG